MLIVAHRRATIDGLFDLINFRFLFSLHFCLNGFLVILTSLSDHDGIGLFLIDWPDRYCGVDSDGFGYRHLSAQSNRKSGVDSLLEVCIEEVMAIEAISEKQQIRIFIQSSVSGRASGEYYQRGSGPWLTMSSTRLGMVQSKGVLESSEDMAT